MKSLLNNFDMEALRSLVNLEEIVVLSKYNALSSLLRMESVAEKLNKLERLRFSLSTVDDLSAFICHSASLMHIVIMLFIDQNGFDTKVYCWTCQNGTNSEPS